jgi:hypothetical protein
MPEEVKILGKVETSFYAACMAGVSAHIEVEIDVEEPIELGDFVTAFTSIANQYRRYMKTAHPDLKDDAIVFVRKIRPGSIIADLIPSAASLIGLMDQVLITEQFIRAYGGRLSQYFKVNGRQEDATKKELSDFMGQVAAIARSKNGSGSIRAVCYEDGKRQIRASVEFNAKQASQATRQIEHHRQELDAIGSADYQRVLMAFKRSDVGDAVLGVRSGERVIIEQISEEDLALVYGSQLAEERIKDQMRNTEENIFHKGFVVDVNVTTKGGRPVAYNVTHVHQIIDLPSE